MLQPPMAHNYNVETSLEKVKRHPKYYLSGGDIHFLVRAVGCACAGVMC